MFFFKTRLASLSQKLKLQSAARAFASKKDHYKVVDCGSNLTTKRWGVKVIKSNVLVIAA